MIAQAQSRWEQLKQQLRAELRRVWEAAQERCYTCGWIVSAIAGQPAAS